MYLIHVWKKKTPKNTQQPRHRVNEPWMQVFNHPHRVSVGWLLFFVLRFSFPTPWCAGNVYSSFSLRIRLLRNALPSRCGLVVGSRPGRWSDLLISGHRTEQEKKESCWTRTDVNQYQNHLIVKYQHSNFLLLEDTNPRKFVHLCLLMCPCNLSPPQRRPWFFLPSFADHWRLVFFLNFVDNFCKKKLFVGGSNRRSKQQHYL